MIQDKTNCSFESIQHTESTNLNIFRIIAGLAIIWYRGLILGANSKSKGIFWIRGPYHIEVGYFW